MDDVLPAGAAPLRRAVGPARRESQGAVCKAEAEPRVITYITPRRRCTTTASCRARTPRKPRRRTRSCAAMCCPTSCGSTTRRGTCGRTTTTRPGAARAATPSPGAYLGIGVQREIDLGRGGAAGTTTTTRRGAAAAATPCWSALTGRADTHPSHLQRC